MKARMFGMGVVTLGLAAGLLSSTSPDNSRGIKSWNPKAAAAHLDQRERWWMTWPPAARDHQTFCISCHTALPYALARPTLRAILAEEGPSPNERELLDSVTKRVRLWKEVKPFYGDEQQDAVTATKARGTEAVLDALILASVDARNGNLSSDGRAALDNMWALQEKSGEDKGSWPWINFRNEPWEANDSGYYGACLAAVAVGVAPQNYRAAPSIQENLKQLRDYLGRQYARQALINQVAVLWASAKLPGLLTTAQQHTLIEEVFKSQRSDGGWSLSNLAWTWRSWSFSSLGKLWIRSEGTPFESKSDGYATGLIVFALEEAGLPRTNGNLQQGLAWLVRNQDQSTGMWPAYSLNKRHAPSSATSYFMSDAATAYAVLALTQEEYTQ